MKTRTPIGFTLIEVAVVIATLGVIATLYFPIIAQAPSVIQAKTGDSNVSKLSKGIFQYMQDNDGKFPRSGFDCRSHNTDPTVFAAGEQNQCGGDAWQDAIGPYVKDKKAFVAANDKSSPGKGLYGKGGVDGDPYNDFRTTDGNLSYLYNDMLSAKMPSRNVTPTDPGYADPANMSIRTDGLRISDVKTPADCLLLTMGHGGWDKVHVDPKAVVVKDWTGSTDLQNKWHHEYGIVNETFLLTTRSYEGTSFTKGTPFSNGGGNVAYVDGHESFKLFSTKTGVPGLCVTMPWTKTMDPQQRGADKDSCTDAANPLGAGWSSSNWF